MTDPDIKKLFIEAAFKFYGMIKGSEQLEKLLAEFAANPSQAKHTLEEFVKHYGSAIKDEVVINILEAEND